MPGSRMQVSEMHRPVPEQLHILFHDGWKHQIPPSPPTLHPSSLEHDFLARFNFDSGESDVSGDGGGDPTVYGGCV